jgi:hypothetical protein
MNIEKAHEGIGNVGRLCQIFSEVENRVQICTMQAGLSCGYHREYWLGEVSRAERKLWALSKNVSDLLNNVESVHGAELKC